MRSDQRTSLIRAVKFCIKDHLKELSPESQVDILNVLSEHISEEISVLETDLFRDDLDEEGYL